MGYKLQKKILRKQYGSRCMLCERPLQKKKCTFHHKIPKSVGGSNDVKNACILCSECQTIIHSFKYGTEGYQKLTEKIEKNEEKYKKY